MKEESKMNVEDKKVQRRQKTNLNIIQKLVIRLALLIVVIAILIGAIYGTIFSKPQTVGKNNIDPELARAMEYPQVQDGEEKIKIDQDAYPEYEDGVYPYVQFDAFFLRDLDKDGYAESVRGTCREVGKEDTLYMELKLLTNGYIKEGATITINDNRNFYFDTAIVKDKEVKENYIGNNIGKIELNQIGDGTNGVQKLLTGIVKSGDYKYESDIREAIENNIENYSQENTITFRGIHVRYDENGETTEVPIEKTVKFNVDWYGETKAEIPQYINSEKNIRQNSNIEKAIDKENNEINLEFNIGIEETKNQLIISKSYVEGTIPQLNGYDPKKVEITGTNVEYTYEKETRKFTAQREAILDENEKEVKTVAYTGIDTKERRYNKYKLKITYELEAYENLGQDTIEYRLPVRAYYEGYNNKNKEFENPHISNIAEDVFVITFKKPEGEKARFDVYVGKYMYWPTSRRVVSKQKPLKIYNEISEEEEGDYYPVEWHAYTGTQGESKGIIMKETKDLEEVYVSDQFLKKNNEKEGMEEVSSFVGIYFSDPTNMLGEDGEINVYDDETDQLLVTFNKNNWNIYKQSNPYMYEVPVKHIRVETTATNISSSICVYNIKEIYDDIITNKYDREGFDNLIKIQSTLTGYLENTYINTDTKFAYYEAPTSVAYIRVDKSTISTQETENNYNIRIEIDARKESNEEEWINGSFLIKLPKDIIDIKLNSVNIDNEDVNIINYEKYEENGELFIRVDTENTIESTYNIIINCDITPNPRIPTKTETIELYAHNENSSNYYYSSEDIYDVNNNLNTGEQVNKRTTSLNLVSPNSLLTTQLASQYDKKESEAIAPQIALVDREKSKATMTIEITSNYAKTISEVKILGKVPYIGNKYVINGSNMNSEFNATMSDKGIILPQELQGIAKVYYSESENVKKELDDKESQWKDPSTEDINFKNVKSFLIDLQSKSLEREETYQMTYEVEIPNEVPYNQISYTHHAVYFSLETENGKYRTKTEPNKLGLMVAKKYNLQITKYQKESQKVVPGATYSIQEEGKDEKNTKVTMENGKFMLRNLYVEKTYILKEIKSPSNYELNREEVKFKVKEENGELSIQELGGTIKDKKIQELPNYDYQVDIALEDEVKVNLNIKKVEKQSQEDEVVLPNVYFKITGTGLPEAGQIISTNTNGNTTVTGLKVGGEYTLEEIKSEGYYLLNPVKFTITRSGDEYNANILQGEEQNLVKINPTTNEDGIPIINFVIENEKVQRAKLEITKIEKVVESTLSTSEIQAKEVISPTSLNYIQGAKFKLYKDNREIGTYETDASGKAEIEDLYVSEEEKNINEIYTLKEVYAPSGYTKVKDITFIIKKVGNNIQFEEILEKNQTAKKYEVVDDKIKLTIEDSPSFKLIKKDKETSIVMQNIKFAIYNIDKKEEPARNSKGEILGEKEIINGKEYYVLKTDESGEIIADLGEGLYKLVELEAPDEYDISDKTYYFGIGQSVDVKTSVAIEWAKKIGTSRDSNADNEIASIAETRDGGIIAVGSFYDENIILENNADEWSIQLNNNGLLDGMIIKYNNKGEVEWAKAIGGASQDKLNSVVTTSDGGYLACGYCSGSLNLGEDVNGNNITFNRVGNTENGLIIKYNMQGEIEYATLLEGTNTNSLQGIIETDDGKIIVAGQFKGQLNIGKDINGRDIELTNTYSSYDDGIIIKYGKIETENAYEYVVENNKLIGGTYNDSINTIIKTKDGGYLIGGKIGDRDSIYLGEDIYGEEIYLYSTGNLDGIVVKYAKNDKVEWAKNIGGSRDEEIYEVDETDDGYLIAGYMESDSLTILSSNGSDGYIGSVKINSNGNNDGIIVKLDKNGKPLFGKAVGSGSSDTIYSITGTNDGGYIIGAIMTLETDFGDDINGNPVLLQDECIIKFNEKNELEWGIQIGTDGLKGIKALKQLSDESYIMAGGIRGEAYLGQSVYGGGIGIPREESTENYALIVKYVKAQLPEVTTTYAARIGENGDDQLTKALSTKDGGSIAIGNFNSSNISLGQNTELNNNGNYDGMVIKYNAKQEIEWAKVLGGTGTEKLYSIEEMDDGYIIVGSFRSNTIDLGENINNEDIILRNNGSLDGMIIKYNENGELVWATTIGNNGNDCLNTVKITDNNEILVAGYFQENINLDPNTKINSNGDTDGIIIKYDDKGEYKWSKIIGGLGADYITSMTTTKDGGIVVIGSSSGNIYLGKDENGDNIEIGNKRANFVIKISKDSEVQWLKDINVNMTSITEISDGGYVIGGYYNSDVNLGKDINGNEVIVDKLYSAYTVSDAIVIKYNEEGKLEWARPINSYMDEEVLSVAQTSDGGFVATGYSAGTVINIGLMNIEKAFGNGLSDGIIVKYDENGKIEWTKQISGRGGDDVICSVDETEDGEYLLAGYFDSLKIEMSSDINYTNRGKKDAMIFKVDAKVGIEEMQELTIQNEIKEFDITTDIEEINGQKGGSISGEDMHPYERVKYGETTDKTITITPKKGYEITKITKNGVSIQFEKQDDGSYTFPPFSDVKENIHIVASFAQINTKFLISKKDNDGKTPLAGAKFKIEQIGKVSLTDGVIGNIESNAKEYTVADEENDITTEVIADMNIKDNGDDFIVPDMQEEIQGLLGEISNNGEIYEQVNWEKEIKGALKEEQKKDDPQYYFVRNEEGIYEPTNGRTYGSNRLGIPNSTAHSYFPIDLSSYDGKAVVVINARISNDYGDYAYAIITNNTDEPSTSESGKFMEITGWKQDENYISAVLDGNNTYYLHLLYKKNQSSDDSADAVLINSMKLYEVISGKYFFEVNNNVYESNNKDQIKTVANSCIPIDLRDKEETENIAVVVNAQISGSSSNYGYATIKVNDTTPPQYSDSDGRFIYVYGEKEAQNYKTILQGGSLYYLHLGYRNQYDSTTSENVFRINSIKTYKTKVATYNFTTEEITDSDSEDGLKRKRYVSTNQGEAGTVSNSYIPINIKTDGQVVLRVNAEISSENYDYGYVTVTNTKDRVKYNENTSKRFVYISGERKAQDYEIILDGNSEYYLHFGYYKNENTDAGTDQFIINSINVYKAIVERYDFETKNMTDEDMNTTKKYVSTNAGRASTVSYSYIPINLQGYTGNYRLIVNAEISSDENDMGYATISDKTDRVGTYQYSDKRFIYISGEKEAKDYSIVLEGNKQYYLHLGYYKNSQKNEGKDQFIINNIELVDNDLYKTEVITDNLGQAFADLPITPTAKYVITEIEAPEGYELSTETHSYTMLEGAENKLELTNNKKPVLIVHHYEKGTDKEGMQLVKVAEDEKYIGKTGEEYETKPKTNLERYELAKKEEVSGEEMQDYDIPLNAKGTYEPGVEEVVVTYYYTKRPIPLIVHHYIEGTTNKVLNKNGEEISDIVTSGNEGTGYTTQVISNEELDEKYEALEAPENATGNYEYPKVEVTYEYRVKTYEITTKVQTHMEEDENAKEPTLIEVKGGSILGEGERPYETVEYGESNKREITITPEQDYQVKTIKINERILEENEYTKDEQGNITLNTIDNIKQNQEVVVEFEKAEAEVVVHHYIYDKFDEEYTQTKVHSSSGAEIEDVNMKGKAGDLYGTEVAIDLQPGYKLFEEPSNSSGIMKKGLTEVNYYYATDNAYIESNITKEGTQIITSKEEEVHYKIKYTAQINNYEGNAKVTITDTLPYNLDQDAMKKIKGVNSSENDWIEKLLNGGKYDDETREITWTETVPNINTFTDNTPRTIEIEKNITVIFNGISTAQTSTEFTNTVKGKIELNTTEQTEETEEVPYTTTAKFVKNIKVTKTWEHGNNTTERPTAIKIYVRKVKAGQAQQEEPIAQCELNSKNNWTHIFTDLPKYDAETGEEIEYTVEEQAIEGESLDYYKRVI